MGSSVGKRVLYLIIGVLLIAGIAFSGKSIYLKMYANQEKAVVADGNIADVPPSENNHYSILDKTVSSMQEVAQKELNKKQEKIIIAGSKKKSIPVLYYHAVGDKTFGLEELFVRPSEFEKQMEYLKNNNYTVIDLENIDKAPQTIEKPVVITFDDGYSDNYTNAYPILKKHNFCATIFVIVNALDADPNFLKKSQIKEMKDLISFQSHTLTHPRLTEIKRSEIEKELAESKRILESITGREVHSFAYPIGDYDGIVLELTKKYYKYAVRNAGGMHYAGNSNYEINRIYVPRNLSMQRFEEKLKQN